LEENRTELPQRDQQHSSLGVLGTLGQIRGGRGHHQHGGGGILEPLRLSGNPWTVPRFWAGSVSALGRVISAVARHVGLQDNSTRSFRNAGQLLGSRHCETSLQTIH
jgi:hypothetical protein